MDLRDVEMLADPQFGEDGLVRVKAGPSFLKFAERFVSVSQSERNIGSREPCMHYEQPQGACSR
jgi:hypothetical protein